MKICIRARALSVLLALSGLGATAHGESYPARQHDRFPDNAVERAGAIEYVTGGVGLAEQQQLAAYAEDHDYNLKVVFTLEAGNYLADVDVLLKDQRGETLVRDVSDSPFFVARVPAGTYTVTATHDGKMRSRSVHVTADGLRTVYMRWPANPATDFTLLRTRDPMRDTPPA